MKRVVGALVVVAALSSPAFAQTERFVQEPDREIVRERTDIIFAPRMLTGDPDGSLMKEIYGKRKTDFDLLIKVRMNFHPELQRSTENL